ncbi:GDSL family lipase [Brevundimonas sp. Leaf363]|uniref:SGNH/GDSL hydrolase family protein n=1 Tax=Brevundimonas sp. Leaf363 TaxID=1736353 RepID=UPI0006F84A79|nr:SGNH/GDSL hydrolase family protein [Brevundimonas sp. Leaf363]KQS53913.1 GDSL family lipase [Brevundimonas sp. Leaf363]
MTALHRRSLLGLGLAAGALSMTGAALASAPPHARWMRSWSSAQMAVDGANALPPEAIADATLRQCVRLTLGGSGVRVRVSNLFGADPLTVLAGGVARPVALNGSAVMPGSHRALSFDGRPSVIVPPGAEYLSDPVDLTVAAFDSLMVSLHLAVAPGVQTGHPGSRATSYVLARDQTAAGDMPGATRADHWWFLSGVDVRTTAAPGVMVIGDSITDGYGVQPNTNARWTDALAERLAAERPDTPRAVLNAGFGGNRLLADGVGPGVLSRFERDVLSVPGVGHAIVLIGVNDLGVMSRDNLDTPDAMTELAHRMISALAQIALRGREAGVRMIGGTITPFVGSDYYHPGPVSEAARQAVNNFIRSAGAFDSVIDFDAALRDPADPSRLLAAYDNDHLHPTIAGYRAMAEAVDLSLFD